MAGQTLRILDKNTYSVTAAQLPLNQVLLIPVAINVPTTSAVYAALVLRCHAFSFAGGTGTAPGVRLFAYVSAPTKEDPNTLYRSSAAAITGSKIVAASPFTPSVNIDPSLTVGNLGAYMDVILELSQWTTGAAALTVVVSADLVLKS